MSGRKSVDRFSGNEVLTQLRLLPNLISLTRIVLVWPIAVFYSIPTPLAYWTVLLLIVISYISDFIDGFVARQLSQQSRLGLVLDPVADKIWTIAMVFLIYFYRGFPMWIMAVIILRDITILYFNLRLYMRNGQIMSSDEIGRKYMVVLGLLVIGYTLRIPGIIWLAYFLVVMAGVTWVHYYSRYSKKMRTSTVV